MNGVNEIIEQVQTNIIDDICHIYWVKNVKNNEIGCIHKPPKSVKTENNETFVNRKRMW